MEPHRQALSSDQIRRTYHAQPNMTSHSASFDPRTRSEDSWVEIASQPSSSSLSSIDNEVVTTGLRVQRDPRVHQRRSLRHNRVPAANTAARPISMGRSSSQEEYEESESESDRVMTSSGEGPNLEVNNINPPAMNPVVQSEGGAPQVSDDDDENRTAINYPIRNDQCFTPQPNAFSHPPSSQIRGTGQSVPGSYFPSQRRSSTRQSSTTRHDTNNTNHMPQNILSPSYNTAAQHDEALRTSLSTLLSCAAAARGLSKADDKRQNVIAPQPRRNRVEPLSLRLVPESQLPSNSPPQLQEPTFMPTLRRSSTSTSTSSEMLKENKRKARNSSRERRAVKKARHTSSSEDLHVTPTLLTWVVSAGVVVFLSALSFSAGYSVGKEAGRLEAGSLASNGEIRSCAREAGRTSLGLKRSLARSAVVV